MYRTLLICFGMVLGFSGCVIVPKIEKQDIYIPVDLDDCFRELKQLYSEEEILKLKDSSEEDLAKYHFGVGLWMRNNWGLWKGSRLAEYFQAMGITHPDDMTWIIITSFWRHLNNKPILLEEQIQDIRTFWDEAKKRNDHMIDSLGVKIEE